MQQVVIRNAPIKKKKKTVSLKAVAAIEKAMPTEHSNTLLHIWLSRASMRSHSSLPV